MFNVADGIGSAGVFRYALVMEIHFSGCINGHVFQQGVAMQGVINIRFGFFVQVDDLGVAAAFQIEDAVIVPAVLVVADKVTVGIRGQSSLAGAGQTKENCRVLTLQVRVSGAVHGSNALQRQVVVHHGEHAFFHLAAVPGVQDHLFVAGNVKCNTGFRIDAQFLVVLHFCFGRSVHYKIRFEIFLFLFRRGNKHILNKVRLPGHFHNETHRHAGILVGAAERVHHKQPLAAELLHGQRFHLCPYLFTHDMVIIRVFGRRPPHRIFGIFIHDDVLVLWGTPGINAGHNVHGIQLGQLAFFIPFQTGLHFFFE